MSAPSSAQDSGSVDKEIVALVAAEAAVRARLTRQLVAMITASARRFHGWYDTDAITEWAAKLARNAETIQRAVAQSTDVYLARTLSQMTGARVRPIGRVDVAGLRNGVTHAGAYARAADTYRWQQSQFDAIAHTLLTDNPKPPGALMAPLEAAVQRAAAVADMDAQLAVRGQEQASMSAAADKGVVTGFRRVIHPELSKGGTCGLCIAASDRLYGPYNLKPIHGHCECTTLPVIDGADPGSALNRLDLKRLYRTAGGTDRQKLKSVRYQVDEHGELGPVLNPAGQKVRTERQANRDTNRASRGKSEDAKFAQIERIRRSLEKTLPKARELAAADPAKWGDYTKQLEARIRDLSRQTAA